MNGENECPNGQEDASASRANFLRRIMDKPGILAPVIGVVAVGLGVVAVNTDGIESKVFTAGGVAGGLIAAAVLVIGSLKSHQNNEPAH